MYASFFFSFSGWLSLPFAFPTVYLTVEKGLVFNVHTA